MPMMKAAIFVEPNRIVLDDKPIPEVGPLDALMRITTTTICGTDVHILKGEYPVARGLTIGHEPVGVIEKLGSAVHGYREGQRVIAGAITPSGWSNACLCGAAFAGRRRHASMASRPLAAGSSATPSTAARPSTCWCPTRMANLAAGARRTDRRAGADVPGHHVHRLQRRRERQGPHRRHRGRVRPGPDRPVRHRRAPGSAGASLIIGVDMLPERLEMSRKLGADHVVDPSQGDVVEQIMQLTGGRGVDVAIEALGTQKTFEAALRVLRPGGTLSSLGVYSSDLTIPLDAFAAGLGDHRIVTALCPGGKERMRRLMSVIASRPRRPGRDGHPPLQAGRHRGRLRPVLPPARRRVEGGDNAVAGRLPAIARAAL